MAYVLRFILSSPIAFRLCRFCGRVGAAAKEILLLSLYGEEGIAMLERRKAYINDSTEEDEATLSMIGETNEREQLEDLNEKEQKQMRPHHKAGKKRRWYHKPLFGQRSRFTWKFAWEVTKSVCVLWLVLLILSWNLGNLGFDQLSTPNVFKPLARGLHLDQNWNMFSPRPPDLDWWYIIQAWMVNGTEVELHRNEGMWKWEGVPVGDWSKPDPFHLSFGNHRWYKFYEQMNGHSQNQQIRLEYGRFICREWNTRHPLESQVYEFKIWWMNEFQLLDGTTEPREKELLWHHICMDNKPIWPPPTMVEETDNVKEQ